MTQKEPFEALVDIVRDAKGPCPQRGGPACSACAREAREIADAIARHPEILRALS